MSIGWKDAPVQQGLVGLGVFFDFFLISSNAELAFLSTMSWGDTFVWISKSSDIARPRENHLIIA